MKRRAKEDRVCNFPGDFTKLTSWSELSIGAALFVCGSHGVNAILEEPALQSAAVCVGVALVDSVRVCVCVYVRVCVVVGELFRRPE